MREEVHLRQRPNQALLECHHDDRPASWDLSRLEVSRLLIKPSDGGPKNAPWSIPTELGHVIDVVGLAVTCRALSQCFKKPLIHTFGDYLLEVSPKQLPSEQTLVGSVSSNVAYWLELILGRIDNWSD